MAEIAAQSQRLAPRKQLPVDGLDEAKPLRVGILTKGSLPDGSSSESRKVDGGSR